MNRRPIARLAVTEHWKKYDRPLAADVDLIGMTGRNQRMRRIETTSDVESLDRRQMLQFAAVVFARHLAGCGTVDAGEELQTADERIRSLAASAADAV